MPSEITDELKAEIGRLHRSGKPLAVISEELNCSISTASKYKDFEPEAEAEAGVFESDGEKATIRGVSQKFIETEDDAWDFGKFDRNIWFVKRIKCVAHQMGFVEREVKTTDKATGLVINNRTPGTRQLWNVTLFLERKLPVHFTDAADAIYERLAAIAPRDWSEAPAITIDRPAMACLDLFDPHFGKLSWEPESGEDYDLKISERRYRACVARLVEHASPYSIDQAVLTIGNDMVHIDNLSQSTTKGTPVDTDGRLAKIIEVVACSLIDTIEYVLRKAATVKVLYVPGNHDKVTSYFLSREIKAYFRHNDRIEVDCGPSETKYIHWYRNLIGYNHGESIRDPRDFQAVMIHDKPAEYVGAVSREWHLGHLHTHKSVERFGIICRTLSSLSASDAWHRAKGYVGNRKVGEMYLYDRDHGLIGNFIAGGE